MDFCPWRATTRWSLLIFVKIYGQKGPCGRLLVGVYAVKGNGHPFSENVGNQFWTMLPYVKKCAEFESDVRFA